ncbi:MAG: aminotransferase class V-fold PLP-dependent enzyme [Xanthobacteraceae bacterium]
MRVTGPSVSRSEWLLDPEVTFLNHGSYGATPRAVLAEQDRWRQRMEARPTAFMSDELPRRLRDAAGGLAAFVGGNGEDYGFVENATVGCNAVLNSIRLATGDEILLTDHVYPAVRKAAAHVAGRAGASVVEASVPFPLRDAGEIIGAVAERLGPRTRLVILDHVTSPTAAIFPVTELTALCNAKDARVLIDGAHAPGMLSLDIPAIGADWYVGNCHKWLMAPKGSGFLWARRASQQDLHPLAISHGYGRGFTAEFDWTGTRDPSAWLAVPAAIDFHLRLGGPSLRERNAVLAREAAGRLAERWKTARGTPDSLTGSMVAVRLPLPGPANDERAQQLRAWLFEAHRIEVAVVAFADALWVRISAQAYNEGADYDRLARAVASILD